MEGQPVAHGMGFRVETPARLGQAHLQISDGPMELGIQLEGDRHFIRPLCEDIPKWAKGLLSDVSLYYPLLKLKGKDLVLKSRWPEVVQKMIRAVQLVDGDTLTPMSAVAGAIAQEILDRAFCESDGQLVRMIVNNGGDMAIFSPRTPVIVGVRGAGMTGRRIEIPPNSKPYGVATSGWRGRSFSQGIADAVVTVSSTASVADAAATFIGNHVWDEGISSVKQKKAGSLDPETDIPDLTVTVSCGHLTEIERAQALHNGRKVAELCLRRGVVQRVDIYLQGERISLDALAKRQN